MTFKEWIASDFKNGRVAASKLGIPYSTLRGYLTLERFPRAKALQVLMIKSDGRLDAKKWLVEYTQRGITNVDRSV